MLASTKPPMKKSEYQTTLAQSSYRFWKPGHRQRSPSWPAAKGTIAA